MTDDDVIARAGRDAGAADGGARHQGTARVPVGPDRLGVAVLARPRPLVSLGKDEAFELCDGLARAELVLRAGSYRREADELARLFNLVEARLF
jgi:hypothetical protein